MKGLIIKEPWISLILSRKKTWELRSRDTRVRGRIALIRKDRGRWLVWPSWSAPCPSCHDQSLSRTWRNIEVPGANFTGISNTPLPGFYGAPRG